MPELLEAPADVDPFGDLIPQEKVPSDIGDFADLVPSTNSVAIGSKSAGQDFGDFSDLVPASPTSESEKALAETPQPLTDYQKLERNIGRIAPPLVGLHEVLNVARVLANSAGRYIFRGLEGQTESLGEIIAGEPPSVAEGAYAEGPEYQAQLEEQYHSDVADQFKQLPEELQKRMGIDPTLADTAPARIAEAAGPAVVASVEALIPGIGLPLMIVHGAQAAEAEAKHAGKSDDEAEDAGTRAAVGLGLFGGVNKLASVAVAQVLPRLVKNPGKLAEFIGQFAGQYPANEASSRAIAAWEAAENAPAGQKLAAAVDALGDQTLEGGTFNVVYALMHAAKATGRTRMPVERATSAVSEPVRSPAPETGVRPETARYTRPPVEEASPKMPSDGSLWYQGVGPEGQTSWVTSNFEKAQMYASRRGEGGKINVYTPEQVGETAFADQNGNLLSSREYSKTQSTDTTIQTLGRENKLPAPLKTIEAPIGVESAIAEIQRRNAPTRTEPNAASKIGPAEGDPFLPPGDEIQVRLETASERVKAVEQIQKVLPVSKKQATRLLNAKDPMRELDSVLAENGHDFTKADAPEHVAAVAEAMRQAENTIFRVRKTVGPRMEEYGESVPNAASRISLERETVPEYLRPDPELVRLINEPTATVKPAMKMAAAGEGGALFSRGGARATVTPKGTTPKGDTNFLRVESGSKRLFKGLERKGDADVIADTPNKVGKMLSNSMRRHTDLALEIKGQLSAKVDRAAQGPRKKIDAALDELEPYLAARENGRPTPALSPKAQEILSAWEDVAESTGNLARANDVQVFDPKLGAHRQIGNLGRTYLPRAFKPEVERAMRDPAAKKNTPLWNTLVDAFAKHRGISDVEAARELRAEAGRFASNDYMGNLERARTGQLPEIFYDYDLRRIMPNYVESFSERMAQIIAYGQRLGPRENPQRENLWDIARKEAENGYTQEWLNSSEDRATNTRARTPLGKFTAGAQTAASGLYLSSPTTTVQRNIISGFLSTTELMGLRRSLSNVVRSFKAAERSNAREIGAIQRDMGAVLHADQLGDSALENAVRGFTRGALKYSGYTFGEDFVRTNAFLASSQFAREGVAALAKNPKSMRAKEALGLFQRMRVNAETIFAEGANWETGPETRKFIRAFIKATQGGYRFDQVPGFAQSNTGRFLYQYGRYGTMRSQNIARNGLRPLFGEEVTWNGKTMSRWDARPIAKMAASSVLAGETFGLLASLMFGRDRKDASLNEIKEAWKEDEKLAVALAIERVTNDIIMSGMFGIWGQPIDWARSLKNQSRLKNPMEPPGLGSIEALKDLGQAALDQGLDLTKNDLLQFAGKVVPGVKQTTDVARNIFDESVYEAQNDVKTLRAAAQRWAKREGMDVSPRNKGDFRKSAMAPEYEPIKEALLVGDAQTAKVLAADFLSRQPDAKARGKAKLSLKASVQASQPFRAGPYTAKAHREKFQTWARKNLSEADYLQTKRIQERYMKAAQAAELW